MSFTVCCNDVLDELRQVPDNTFHGGLSDFPYGLTPVLKHLGKTGSNPDQGVGGFFGRVARGFLGQTWDELPTVEACREMLRTFRPGAYFLVFAHPRTHHRLACNLEDAGWVIGWPIIWVYPKGFPKSHNISKAIAKMLGDQRQAQMWNGYGTGLRGVFEPIVVAMKPLQGTYAANACQWGVAGLNLGACRIPCSDKPRFPSGTYANRGLYGVGAVRAGDPNPDSRWPANLILGDVDTFLGYETLFQRCPRALPWEKNAGLDEYTNDHPCAKPLGLCRLLARLILPPLQDTPRRLLVPYAGTGSEIIGAMLAGWDDALAIERETGYVDTARKRIRFWRRWGGDLPTCIAGRSVDNSDAEASARSTGTAILDTAGDGQGQIVAHGLKVSRYWAMPSRETFTIKPIAELLARHINAGDVVVDPFARNSTLGTLNNDLNPNTKAQYHMHAEEFCKMLAQKDVFGDVVLFDPPYSSRQLKEVYEGIGQALTQRESQAMFSEVKDALSGLLRPGGLAISCGWNSTGFGLKRGYEQIEMLVVCHGTHHNDTIVVVERKRGL